MPLYSYRCPVCDCTTDLLHSHAELATPSPETRAATTHCQQPMVREMSAPLLMLSGAGLKTELRKRTRADFQRNIKEKQMNELGYARKQS